uniref:Uncharacterized protein n=1 Tax=Strigamia maritima TaxID=126957 RepID=T1JIK6_STRMM
MVQTEDQYIYIHTCLRDLLMGKTASDSEPLYANICKGVPRVTTLPHHAVQWLCRCNEGVTPTALPLTIVAIVVSRRFLVLDGRFLALDGRFLALDGRFLALDGRFLALDGRFLALDGRIQTSLQQLVLNTLFGDFVTTGFLLFKFAAIV